MELFCMTNFFSVGFVFLLALFLSGSLAAMIFFQNYLFLGIFSRNGVLRVYLSEFFKLIVATSSLPVLSREFTKIKL